MHAIYNMYSKYTYYTVPRIIYRKENCSKIDFFFWPGMSQQQNANLQTVQMSKQALKMVKT